MKIYNIEIEFNHNVFRQKIVEAIVDKKPGYVCIVDANVLATTNVDKEYAQIVRDSMVNTCDGSSLATFANKIYHLDVSPFTGPEIFAEFIQKSYRQLLLGNREETVDLIRQKMRVRGIDDENLLYMPLPFCDVDEFDYSSIAEAINKLNVDVVWISLGAPKQERFMANILPYMKQGVMFGIGAAFNYYIGRNRESVRIGIFRFNWLERFIREPKKQGRRLSKILVNYPSILIREWKKSRKKSLCS